MADPLLNYVRCPYCGGNLADMNHPCDDEARDRAAKEAVESMMAALTTPPEKATKDQLRRKLIECEAALASTEAALEDHEAAVSAAVEAERRRWETVADAARALCALHIPYGAYVRWRESGDAEPADRLSEYDDALNALRRAIEQETEG